MKSTYTVTQAQANLPKIARANSVVAITRHQEITGFYVPKEKWEDLLEAIEIAANPEIMKTLKKFKDGKMKFKSLAETKKELGVE